MNNDNLKTELDAYLGQPTPKAQPKSEVEQEIVITPKTGLVERIEKKLVTPDGRILLTERNY